MVLVYFLAFTNIKDISSTTMNYVGGTNHIFRISLSDTFCVPPGGWRTRFRKQATVRLPRCGVFLIRSGPLRGTWWGASGISTLAPQLNRLLEARCLDAFARFWVPKMATRHVRGASFNWGGVWAVWGGDAVLVIWVGSFFIFLAAGIKPHLSLTGVIFRHVGLHVFESLCAVFCSFSHTLSLSLSLLG